MTGAAVVGLLTLGAFTACFIAVRALARTLAQQLGPDAIARFIDEINVRTRRADAIAERAAQRLLHRRTHVEPPGTPGSEGSRPQQWAGLARPSIAAATSSPTIATPAVGEGLRTSELP